MERATERSWGRHQPAWPVTAERVPKPENAKTLLVAVARVRDDTELLRAHSCNGDAPAFTMDHTTKSIYVEDAAAHLPSSFPRRQAGPRPTDIFNPPRPSLSSSSALSSRSWLSKMVLEDSRSSRLFNRLCSAIPLLTSSLVPVQGMPRR